NEAHERIRAMQRVRHPSLLAVRELDEEHGYCYFVTDAPAGVPLSQLGRIPVGQAIRLGLDLAAGLLAMEDSGLRHGRVVPERISIEGLGERRGRSRARVNPFLEELPASPRLGLLALSPSRLSEGTSTDPQSLGAIVLRLVRGAELDPQTKTRKVGGDLG